MLQDILALDPARLGLIGIVLSALVASLGYYGKVRHERKRTRRVVLFYLLRLREAALWEDRAATNLPGTLVETIGDTLKRHDLAIDEDFKKSLVRTATRSLTTFLSDHTKSVTGPLVAGLEKALLDLAKDDPLLASRVADGIPEASPSWKAEIPTHLGEVNESPSFSSTLVIGMLEEARRTTLRRLTSTLRLTAIECSVWSWMDIELKLWLQSRWKPAINIRQPISLAIDELVQAVVKEERVEKTKNPTLSSAASEA